jgi:hypoxanthine phosphoribosyltransferase
VGARVVLVVDEVVVTDARVVLVVDARVVLDVVVVGTRVVLVVDDVVVAGTRVVLVVDEVGAPTSVTLITFDGVLNDGAAPACRSATMATVSVFVCPGAGSPTVNVSVQGVAAHTTEAGSLSTWVQTWDPET